MSETLDLIPWETRPELPEQKEEVIEFRGGVLKLPRLGYMTADEMEHIRCADPQNAIFLAAARASVEMVQAEQDEWSPRAAYALLLKLQATEFGLPQRLTEAEQDLRVRHAQLIAGYLQEVRVISNRVVVASVTAILRRVRPAWTDDQTMRLPGGLISAVHAFEQDEELAGAPAADPAAALQQLDDALGKLDEAIPSARTDPDGPTSFGNADGSTPAPSSSHESGSGDSPAASSSKRSPRASKPRGRRSTAAS
jgi:hypothetical protein